MIPWLSILEDGDPSLENLVENLISMNILSFDHVDILSTVSIVFMTLTSPRITSLAFCNLYGDFPSRIPHLSKLQAMILSSPGLVLLLSEFRPNSSPRKLHLHANGIYDELPFSIGNLGCLKDLTLWHCHFTGMIPSTTGNLLQLSYSYLYPHDFWGYIPSSSTSLIHLGHFSISYLFFRSKDLVTWFPKLNKLSMLLLHGFDLHNELSSSLVNLNQIKELDLSDNQLKGSMLCWLAHWSQMSYLMLEGNKLSNVRRSKVTGPILEWICQLSNLVSLGLGYNGWLLGDFITFVKLQTSLVHAELD